MKKFKNLSLALLAIFALSLTSCLHIVETLSLKNDGSGNYKLHFDMSEMKGMMDMMKGMTPDSLKGAEGAPEAPGGNQMAEMGEQLTSVTPLLQAIGGITNIVEVNDTAAFAFSYSFDFANQDALNRALKAIGKEKYQTKADETFLFSKKKFQRFSVGNIGAEIKKQLGEGDEEAGGMEQMAMFFAEMTYKQVYNFEKTVKSSSNKLSEIGDDKHSVTITIKPFDEEQAKTFPSVASDIKLK